MGMERRQKTSPKTDRPFRHGRLGTIGFNFLPDFSAPVLGNGTTERDARLDVADVVRLASDFNVCLVFIWGDWLRNHVSCLPFHPSSTQPRQSVLFGSHCRNQQPVPVPSKLRPNKRNAVFHSTFAPSGVTGCRGTDCLTVEQRRTLGQASRRNLNTSHAGRNSVFRRGSVKHCGVRRAQLFHRMRKAQRPQLVAQPQFNGTMITGGCIIGKIPWPNDHFAFDLPILGTSCKECQVQH